MIDAMNLLHVDYICLGNHEFDDPNELHHLQFGNFTIVSTNITGIKNTVPSVTVKCGQNELLLLGGCTEETPHLTGIDNSYIFKPINETFEEYIQTLPLLKDKKRIIVGLTHQNVNLDRQLASTGSLDLILGGHEHEPYVELIKNDVTQKSVWMTKVGTEAEYVGVVTIQFSDKNVKSVITTNVYDVLSYDQVDAQLEKYVKMYNQKLQNISNIIIYKFENELTTFNVRSQRSNLITYLGTLILNQFNADIFYLSAGSIRTYGTYSQLSIADIRLIFPYTNYLIKIRIPSSIMRQTILNMSKQTNKGSYPQWVTISGNLPDDSDDLITVCINIALLKGMDSSQPLLDWVTTNVDTSKLVIEDEYACMTSWLFKIGIKLNYELIIDELKISTVFCHNQRLQKTKLNNYIVDADFARDLLSILTQRSNVCHTSTLPSNVDNN
jgi:2',3'-cyclic-nucleotide 2'-phosphodiesterase (5'-nucleotidase family)